MFHLDNDYPIRTWNPIVGCKYHCYNDGCWASRMSKRINGMGQSDRYLEGFDRPKLISKELEKRFNSEAIVFVTSMGDMWGDWVPDSWIKKVLETCRKNLDATFFFETKNPLRYFNFLDVIPPKSILSSTIETNRDYNSSGAPSVEKRYLAMSRLRWNNKHISIEPIVNFDLKIFIQWMKDIDPRIVSVGYDNYNCGLVEPSLSKTAKLIEELREFTEVECKTLREKIERIEEEHSQLSIKPLS